MLKVVKTENGLVRGYPGGGSPGDILQGNSFCRTSDG